MAVAVSATEVRNHWAAFFSRAVHSRQPVAIERGADDLCVLIGADELRLLLADRSFSAEAFFEPGAVSLWLPELALYGRGRSFEEAQSDLVDEVREYVDEYLADAPLYLRASNRAPHFPWVLKAYLADASGRLEDTLFAPAPSGASA